MQFLMYRDRKLDPAEPCQIEYTNYTPYIFQLPPFSRDTLSIWGCSFPSDGRSFPCFKGVARGQWPCDGRIHKPTLTVVFMRLGASHLGSNCAAAFIGFQSFLFLNLLGMNVLSPVSSPHLSHKPYALVCFCTEQ